MHIAKGLSYLLRTKRKIISLFKVTITSPAKCSEHSSCLTVSSQMQLVGLGIYMLSKPVFKSTSHCQFLKLNSIKKSEGIFLNYLILIQRLLLEDLKHFPGKKKAVLLEFEGDLTLRTNQHQIPIKVNPSSVILNSEATFLPSSTSPKFCFTCQVIQIAQVISVTDWSLLVKKTSMEGPQELLSTHIISWKYNYTLITPSPNCHFFTGTLQQPGE